MKKKIRSSVVIMGMALLLLGGYGFPTIVTALEDRGLESAQKSFEIEKIELKTTQIDFLQELHQFPNLMAGDVYMQKRQEEPKDGRVYQQAKETIMEFLGKFHENTEYEFIKMEVCSFALADFETEQFYPVWYCAAVNQDKPTYRFWIDEITGKILGFQIPSDSLQIADIYDCIKIIADYYGFEVCEFQGTYDKSDKIKGWEGVLEVMHNENKEYMYFPFYKEKEVIGFNIYWGGIEITDAFVTGDLETN
uniref:hypothetical protein n=1 Tax=Agathobacter sp. TaxID=2021311 RepID=UPI004057593E